MNLSAPTNIVFIVSVVLAIVSLVVGYAGVSTGAISAFHWALLGYIVLAAGALFKGL